MQTTSHGCDCPLCLHTSWLGTADAEAEEEKEEEKEEKGEEEASLDQELLGFGG